jgi:transposase
MRKIYRFKLSLEERSELESLSRKRNVAAHRALKARVLLLCDESENGEGLKDPEIIEKTGIARATLARLRQRCCEVGPLEALERKQQQGVSRTPKLDGEGQARLITLACSSAPEGCKRWTLRLLADKLVELEVVEAISHETVRAELKKTSSNPG